jgi:hypothetical protein
MAVLDHPMIDITVRSGLGYGQKGIGSTLDLP